MCATRTGVDEGLRRWPESTEVHEHGLTEPARSADPHLDRIGPERVRQAEGVAFVVLVAAALLLDRHYRLVDMGRQYLVEPRALGSLLEAKVPRPRNRLEQFD